MKSIAVLLNLLQYFYHMIQCDKTRNFVHGEAFEVGPTAWNIQILSAELERLTQSITNVQFPSNFLKMSPKL